MKGTWALFAVALLLSGSAAASVLEGSVVVRSPLGFADGARVEGRTLGAYLNHTEHIIGISGEFPRVRMNVYRDQQYNEPLGLTSPQIPIDWNKSSSVHHNVRISLLPGNASGVMGFKSDGALVAGVDLAPGASLVPKSSEVYGWLSVTGSPERPRFTQNVDEPHVYVGASGAFRFSGRGGVYVNGPDLRVETWNETQTIVTGPKETAMPIGSRTEWQWAYIEFEEGNFTVETESPLELALASADLAWSGGASGLGKSGEILLDGEAVDAEGRVHFTGDFTGKARTIMDGTSPRLQFTFAGTPTAIEGAVIPAPVSATSRAFSGLVLVAVALGAGGVAAWLVRRRSRTPVDPDELLTLAHLAGEAGRHDEALGWIRRAREAAPRSAALALEEAFHLGEMGLVEDALRVYREAAMLSRDGQAEFDAALLAQRSSALPPEEVDALLVDALDKNPGLVLELDDSPRLRVASVRSPSLEAAVRRAYRRLDEA